MFFADLISGIHIFLNVPKERKCYVEFNLIEQLNMERGFFLVNNKASQPLFMKSSAFQVFMLKYFFSFLNSSYANILKIQFKIHKNLSMALRFNLMIWQ